MWMGKIHPRENTDFSLVFIFPHSDVIQRDTEYLSAFSPKAEKYGSEETPYLDTFRAVIKTLIEERNATYKIYRHNKDIRDLIYHLQFLQESLSTSIESSKERYYARISDRLNITHKSTKTHWYLLKIFLNNKKNPAYTTAI